MYVGTLPFERQSYNADLTCQSSKIRPLTVPANCKSQLTKGLTDSQTYKRI